MKKIDRGIKRGNVLFIVFLVFLLIFTVAYLLVDINKKKTSCVIKPRYSNGQVIKVAKGQVNPERFIVLDVETTGLNVNNDEIIEIALLKVDTRLNTQDYMQGLIKPKQKIPKFITELTGISQEMVNKDGLEIKSALLECVNFIGHLPIVSFNAKFDMSFLNKALREQGISLNNDIICALERSRHAWPNLSNHKLKTIAEMMGLSTDGHHRALKDCEITLKVYIASIETLQNNENTSNVMNVEPINDDALDVLKRIADGTIEYTDEELDNIPLSVDELIDGEYCYFVENENRIIPIKTNAPIFPLPQNNGFPVFSKANAFGKTLPKNTPITINLIPQLSKKDREIKNINVVWLDKKIGKFISEDIEGDAEGMFEMSIDDAIDSFDDGDNVKDVTIELTVEHSIVIDENHLIHSVIDASDMEYMLEDESISIEDCTINELVITA